VGGNNTRDSGELQAQADKIRELRDELDRVKAHSVPRTGVGKFPKSDEGADADIRVVSDSSGNHLVFKVGGRWHKVKGEQI